MLIQRGDSYFSLHTVSPNLPFSTSQSKLDLSKESVILAVKLGDHLCFITLLRLMQLLNWQLLDWQHLIISELLCYWLLRVVMMLAHLHALLSRKTQSLVNLRVLSIHAKWGDLCVGSHLEHLVLVLGQSQPHRRLHKVVVLGRV